MIYFPRPEAQHLVQLALEEDIGNGDITSSLAIPNNHQSEAFLLAKEEGIIAGLEIIEILFCEMKSSVEIKYAIKDGDRVKLGERFVFLYGPTTEILAGERILLNFIQHLSGVASAAAAFVAEVEGNTRILDTRKTLPAYRSLEKYAVNLGGVQNHRKGLFDMVLVKENHIVAAGGINQAVEKILEKKAKGVKVEVEVETLEQLRMLAPYEINMILLDNMDTPTIAAAVRISKELKMTTKLEASGNMTIDRIREVSRTGVDFISVGAITHSVKALDISMRFVNRKNL